MRKTILLLIGVCAIGMLFGFYTIVSMPELSSNVFWPSLIGGLILSTILRFIPPEEK